jgi:hypothetical protein
VWRRPPGSRVHCPSVSVGAGASKVAPRKASRYDAWAPLAQLAQPLELSTNVVLSEVKEHPWTKREVVGGDQGLDWIDLGGGNQGQPAGRTRSVV